MDRAGEEVDEVPPKQQSLPRATESLSPEVTAPPPVVPAKRTKAKNGFEKGHVAEKLEAVTEEDGERLFQDRWRGLDEVELNCPGVSASTFQSW